MPVHTLIIRRFSTETSTATTERVSVVDPVTAASKWFENPGMEFELQGAEEQGRYFGSTTEKVGATEADTAVWLTPISTRAYKDALDGDHDLANAQARRTSRNFQ